MTKNNEQEGLNVNINQWQTMLDIRFPLPQDEKFLDLLHQNMESLIPYLEELVLDNPFIDVEYYMEQLIPSLEKSQQRNHQHKFESDQTQESIAQQSLETYLFEQIMLFRQTAIRDVMVHLVEYLDDRGFITQNVDEISIDLGQDYFTVLDALTLFKSLEPAGIGASDVRECLMLQAERDDHAPAITYYILESFFDQLVQKDYQTIILETSFSEEEINEVVRYIKTLNHHSTDIFENTGQSYMVTDLMMVAGDSDTIQLQYHHQAAPKLVFNQQYFDEIQQEDDERIQSYLLEKKKQYEKFAIYLNLREKLLLALGSEIIKVQKGLIMHQDDAKGLTLKDLSEATKIPQSYITHLLSGKSLMYQDTIYVLADFINHRYSPGRDGLSADYFRQKVQEVISTVATSENIEIKEKLAQQGITISSKVIEMYRQHSLKKSPKAVQTPPNSPEN